MPDIELDMTQEEYEQYDAMATDLGMGLNEFLSRAVSVYVIRLQREQIDELKIKGEAARYLTMDVLALITDIQNVLGPPELDDGTDSPQGE